MRLNFELWNRSKISTCFVFGAELCFTRFPAFRYWCYGSVIFTNGVECVVSAGILLRGSLL